MVPTHRAQVHAIIKQFTMEHLVKQVLHLHKSTVRGLEKKIVDLTQDLKKEANIQASCATCLTLQQSLETLSQNYKKTIEEKDRIIKALRENISSSSRSARPVLSGSPLQPTNIYESPISCRDYRWHQVTDQRMSESSHEATKTSHQRAASVTYEPLSGVDKSTVLQDSCKISKENTQSRKSTNNTHNIIVAESVEMIDDEFHYEPSDSHCTSTPITACSTRSAGYSNKPAPLISDIYDSTESKIVPHTNVDETSPSTKVINIKSPLLFDDEHSKSLSAPNMNGSLSNYAKDEINASAAGMNDTEIVRGHFTELSAPKLKGGDGEHCSNYIGSSGNNDERSTHVRGITDASASTNTCVNLEIDKGNIISKLNDENQRSVNSVIIASKAESPSDLCPDRDHQTLEDSFDMVPKPEKLNYAHVEVVKKRARRRNLEAYNCQDCCNFYQGVGLTEQEIRDKMQSCSRHRTLYDLPQTPDDFWKIGFPTTQDCVQKGYIKVDTQPGPSRFRRKRQFAKRFKAKTDMQDENV